MPNVGMPSIESVGHARGSDEIEIIIMIILGKWPNQSHTFYIIIIFEFG